MKKTIISGIGLVNRAGISTDELWEHLCGKELPSEQEDATAFKVKLPSSKLRRFNRYSKMALYASMEAWEEAGNLEETDPFRRGTIFTTGYGAMVSHLKFCEEVANGSPDSCSPTVFTGIVPNSCVGTVCMFLKCKGVSTVLMGGNHLEYSKLLLENGNADFILTGAVEEYSQDLFEALAEEPAARGADIAEGCAVFCMEPGGEKTGYCTVERTGTAGLFGFPLLTVVDPEESSAGIEELLRDYDGEQPDFVFCSSNGTYFDEIEEKILRSRYPEENIIKGVKSITGETIGCGFSMNVAAAALCLKHGYIPAALSGRDTDISAEKILVTGFDTAGNYMICVLGK